VRYTREILAPVVDSIAHCESRNDSGPGRDIEHALSGAQVCKIEEPRRLGPDDKRHSPPLVVLVTAVHCALSVAANCPERNLCLGARRYPTVISLLDTRGGY